VCVVKQPIDEGCVLSAENSANSKRGSATCARYSTRKQQRHSTRWSTFFTRRISEIRWSSLVFHYLDVGPTDVVESFDSVCQL